MIADLVRDQAQAARTVHHQLVTCSEQTITAVLLEMADLINSKHQDILSANGEDMSKARENGLAPAMIDRLHLTPDRLQDSAHQLQLLASCPSAGETRWIRKLSQTLVLGEKKIPVGVIGANFEARPNVVLDIASQLIKSRNAGVLRTGSAALKSAAALMEHVVHPALRAHGLPTELIALIPVPDREAAYELVRHPDLMGLVIVRGSGTSTRLLCAEAAQHGVRVLAHADGGGVLYIDRDARLETTLEVVQSSVDRLGVCNRLNLLFVHEDCWETLWPQVESTLVSLGLSLSLPPHSHPLGQEWALLDGQEATVTVQPVPDMASAVDLAHAHTSKLAASIITDNDATAAEFLATYQGTAALHNATTRLVDGFKLLGVPETGINVDVVPGPRGPVTYTDLSLRQFVVVPYNSEIHES